MKPDRDRIEDECVEWDGPRQSKGYGWVRIDGRQLLAHRVAWEKAFGPIPDGLQVLHRCDNPPCVNPEHLWLGTHADNMKDMAEKKRGRKPVDCPHGHPGRCKECVRLRKERHRRMNGAQPKKVCVDPTHQRSLKTGACMDCRRKAQQRRRADAASR